MRLGQPLLLTVISTPIVVVDASSQLMMAPPDHVDRVRRDRDGLESLMLRHRRAIFVATRVVACLCGLFLHTARAAAQTHEMTPPDPAVPAQEQEIDERPKLIFHGFSNVDFSQTDDKRDPGGFMLGQFVLHMSSSLGKKVSFFGETSFTAQSTEFHTEVERVILRYDVNDHLKLSVGRYHTPINYWNTAFHHGLWLQTTISRPEMIQVGQPFQPVHFVGVLAEGNLSSSTLGLGYNAGVGNGRGRVIARAGDAGDVNRNRAWVAKLFARPAAMPSFEFGGATYHDQVPASTGPDVREWITSGYVALTRDSPEVIAEVARVSHEDPVTEQDYVSTAFYLQAAYRLPAYPSWKPYARFEKLLTATGDPLLAQQDLKLTTVGVRYELTGYAAVKAEYRNARRIAGPTNGIYFQAAWTF